MNISYKKQKWQTFSTVPRYVLFLQLQCISAINGVIIKASILYTYSFSRTQHDPRWKSPKVVVVQTCLIIVTWSVEVITFLAEVCKWQIRIWSLYEKTLNSKNWYYYKLIWCMKQYNFATGGSWVINGSVQCDWLALCWCLATSAVISLMVEESSDLLELSGRYLMLWWTLCLCGLSCSY